MAAAPEPGVVVQEVVYAGLDAVRAVVPLDLCAYLHAATGFGPQLYLRSPDLSAMDATQAFELFGALRDGLDGGEAGERALDVAGFDALALLTTGVSSRGLYVMGRRETPLADDEQALVRTLCTAMGVACHAVEASARATPDGLPLRVSVDVVDGTARAEVLVPIAEGVASGRGEAGSPTDAVARATLDAAASGTKLIEAADGSVAGERVMIVLLADEQGRLGIGAALCGPDHLLATASATLEAANRLRG